MVDFNELILLVIGGYSIVGASNSFNQIIEKDKDVLMDRTKNRPLPAKKLRLKMHFGSLFFDSYWSIVFVLY